MARGKDGPAAQRTTSNQSRAVRRKKEARRDEITLSVRIPKHADAKCENPEDWTELGPGEPLPEPYCQRIIEAFAPLMGDFLQRFHLTGDDFDQETWADFVGAYFDSLPERVCTGPKGEETENLIRVLRRALEKKFGPIPHAPAMPPPGSLPAPVREVTFTHRQGQVLAFLHQYRRLHRQGPDEADVAGYFGVTLQSARQVLAKLKALGLVTCEAGVPRSVKVAVPAERLPTLEAAEGPAW